MRRLPRPEHGFITIWLLGLSLCFFFLGGISLDLWRAFTEKRELAAAADSAARAGTSAIDQARFRSSLGCDVVLVPAEAEALARENLRFNGYLDAGGNFTDRLKEPPVIEVLPVGPNPVTVRVTLKADVDLTLLKFLPRSDEIDELSRPIEAGAVGTATVTISTTIATGVCP